MRADGLVPDMRAAGQGPDNPNAMNQIFDKIQMILKMKTSISNNRISQLNETKKKGKEAKQ